MKAAEMTGNDWQDEMEEREMSYGYDKPVKAHILASKCANDFNRRHEGQTGERITLQTEKLTTETVKFLYVFGRCTARKPLKRQIWNFLSSRQDWKRNSILHKLPCGKWKEIWWHLGISLRLSEISKRSG